MARQLTTRQASKTKKQKGFTLIELMVVTAIAGILGAVAMPRFLDARRASETRTIISESVGLGKECATWIRAGGAATGMAEPDGCTAADGGTYTRAMTSAGGMVAGAICIEAANPGDTSADGDAGVTVTVDAIGDMECALA